MGKIPRASARGFLLLLLLFPSVIFANEVAFGGQGAIPIPMTPSPILLQDAHIVITGNNINSNELDGSWQYACDYTFKNNTDQTVQVKMGFPFPVKDSITEISIPKGQRLNKGDPMVYDFHVTVEGKPITPTNYRVPVKKALDYKGAYLWEVTFQPQQILHIHHDYVTGVTVNDMGQSFVNYVLQNGGLWQKGKMASATVEVIPNTPTRFCHEIEENHPSTNLPGVKISGDKSDRRYQWHLTRFSPAKDLHACLLTGRDYIRYRVVYPIAQGSDSIPLNTITAEQLRFLQNAIYAQYGQHFQDAQMQAFFNSQWWYESNLNYSDRMLAPDDKTALALIKKYAP
ncbi:MAG: hypothetical protein A3F10_06430 [Coxiella sp. RIFCSPHIGHO2_12_FULL_42_15]|nr:MAG: hypothetical protein A3F10_06430 [Coxiella sp. RIFCSPHIGHO2_12_FULL_42_15]